MTFRRFRWSRCVVLAWACRARANQHLAHNGEVMRATLFSLIVLAGCSSKGEPSTISTEKPIVPHREERETQFNPNDVEESLSWFVSEWLLAAPEHQNNFDGNGIVAKKAAQRFQKAIDDLVKSEPQIRWRVECAAVGTDGKINLKGFGRRGLTIMFTGPEVQSKLAPPPGGRDFKWQTAFDMSQRPWIEKLRTGDGLLLRGTLMSIMPWERSAYVFVFEGIDLEPIR